MIHTGSYKITSLLTVLFFVATIQLNAQQKAAESNIKVHGNWTITVKNQDGEVVKQRNFENSLEQKGAGALVEMMASEYAFGRWNVSIDAGTEDNDLCQNSDGQRDTCYLTEKDLFQDPNRFETLTLQTPESGDNTNALVLTGNFTADYDGNVGRVATFFAYCDNDTAPQGCDSGAGEAIFTSKSIQGISVSANQQVTVTVVISFS